MMATKLKNLRLAELSLVDEPANKDARVTIFKRAETLDPTAGGPAGDPLSNKETDMTEDAKKVADLQAQITDLTKRAEAADKRAADAGTSLADVTKRAEKAEADLATVTKAKETVEKDEVIKVGEIEVKKSAVGDATFAVIKAQQAEIVKERDARELVELTKRAETEYASLPGEPVAKAKVLKAMAGLGEEDRTALDVMLKAGQAAMDERMAERGTAAGKPVGSAEEELDKLAATYAVENKVNKAAAYMKVLETAEGSKLYSKSLTERPAAH